MEYDGLLTEKLMEMSEVLEQDGLKIEIKPIPDGGRGLDPRARKMEREMQERMSGPQSTPPTLQEVRDSMGGFNYNLCRQEIWTRYIEVETSVGRVPVWGYYPRRGRKVRPALIYVHGGGFIGGTPFTVENPCRYIADRADAVVWNVDYSLPPEHPYPVPCTQVYEVAKYLRDHANEFGMDPGKIVLAGDSAGGNMVASASIMDRDNGTGVAAAQVLLYAKLTFSNHTLPGYKRDLSAFDIAPEDEPFKMGMLRIGSDESNQGDADAYVQDRYPLETPTISPAFGDCAGLPRTLFIQAEYDGLRLEGEYYAKKLQKAGVPVRMLRYAGVCHGFFDALGILPQSEAAARVIAALLNEI